MVSKDKVRAELKDKQSVTGESSERRRAGD
jgi:hypothetical protein